MESVKLERNAELSFLYKNLSVRPNVVSRIALVPEFMDALKSFDGTLDDNAVYEILKSTYRKMLEEGKGYKTAKNVMNQISKDITGKVDTWRN